MTTLAVVRGDITTVEVDAIVNAANSSLMGGAGVDGAIHRAGGPAILEACRDIVARQGGCEPGEAVVTTAGALPARWVIHTVGPIWDPLRREEHEATLAGAYRRCLDLAVEVGAVSVAFPNISTGVYGFPKDRAADVVIGAVRDRVADSPLEQVLFVCFDAENAALYDDRLTPT